MTNTTKALQYYCGYIAIVGRPNVGKSTLLNHLLKQKLSITSRKPQTTRNTILGIKTIDNFQMVFVDTPGMHLGEKKAMNRMMNRSASSVLHDVDLILFVVDRLTFNREDQFVLQQIRQTQLPVILVINKIDKLEKKADLLPYLAEVSAREQFSEIVPVSAMNEQDIEHLEAVIKPYIPPADSFFYDAEQITDRSDRFVVSEIIREKITRMLGEELPHNVAVEIEDFEEKASIFHIHALILVEKKGQKNIVIGDKGSRIKQIGQTAREDIEKLLEKKVNLKLWVKVRSGWSDDERALKSLGLDN
ncbi:MAG: GTPase Era [Pseudomonadales bacterium]|nr:GTPase Era [Pseudomonadales bacterium]